MMKGLVGQWPVVIASGTSLYPSYNMNYQNPLCGMMRWNPGMQNIEAFDGSSWVVMQAAFPNVQLSNDATDAIAWAKQKMADEVYLTLLAADNPVMKDLLDQQNAIHDKIAMVKTLLKAEKEF